MKKYDLIGQRFGKIQVMDFVDVNKDGRKLWKCRCECGNEYITTTTVLLGSRSCRKCINLKDLTGRRFYKLTVIKHQYAERGRHAWLCECDCGNTAVYTSSSLLRGKARTCGKCPRNEFYKEDNKCVGVTFSGDVFYFDLDDWDIVTCRIWHKSPKGYIESGRRSNRVLLHRLVFDVPENMMIDHINRNKTDCRKCNLRCATNALNCANTSTYKNNLSTGHKNVYCANGRFRVLINKNGVAYNYGYYDNLIEAVKVANKKRKELFGEFAFIDDFSDIDDDDDFLS